LSSGVLETPAVAQDSRFEGVRVRRVDVEGLTNIGEGFVRRTIKTREGQPLRGMQVQEDVRALLQTRRFLDVRADVVAEDNEAVVVFRVAEKPEIRSIEIEGNKRFTDDELFKELSYTAGGVLDRYEVNRGRENMLEKYRAAGHYYAEVSLDENALNAEGRVIYRIIEGPRVKVRKIRFEGVRSFPEIQLYFKVRTQTYFPILRTGAFDPEQADRDAVELQAFYRAEGFLDARVGYRLDFDAVDRTSLNVVFVVDEGERYRVDSIALLGVEAFPEERVRAVIQIAPGDVVRDEALQADIKRIEDLYGEIGYVDARVRAPYDFLDQPGVVRLNFDVFEGLRSQIGRITIRGNTITKDEVVRRELRFYPGEDFNTVKTRDARQRLMETGLFNRATITPLADFDGTREALVEVEEGQTVNFIVGVGVSTDNGVGGNFSIENRNFDLFDWPSTWGEFFRGQAFRGAGQRLRFQAEPGTEVSRFRIDFTEPYLMDRPLRLDTSLYLFQRSRESYDEERLGLTASLGKRFESGPLNGWAIEGAIRLEAVEISDIRPLAANDILDAKGNSTLTGLKATIVRDTTDSRILPSKGYRFTVGWEQVGALGGDYSFGRPAVGAAWFKTLSTDVLDRKSILGVRADAAYIVGDAPVFERFYGGGFGSMRAFDFRGISPRAGLFNDRIGGDFIFLTGAEYSFPLYAETLRGVTFLDMGTVEEGLEITEWRAAVGFGLRLNIQFFGPVPFVFDFGWPISKGDDDDTRVFNFSFGASF